jgi:hypothetical protein
VLYLSVFVVFNLKAMEPSTQGSKSPRHVRFEGLQNINTPSKDVTEEIPGSHKAQLREHFSPDFEYRPKRPEVEVPTRLASQPLSRATLTQKQVKESNERNEINSKVKHDRPASPIPEHRTMLDSWFSYSNLRIAKSPLMILAIANIRGTFSSGWGVIYRVDRRLPFSLLDACLLNHSKYMNCNQLWFTD